MKDSLAKPASFSFCKGGQVHQRASPTQPLDSEPVSSIKAFLLGSSVNALACQIAVCLRAEIHKVPTLSTEPVTPIS